MSKVALVTGANRGIGFAIVKRLCLEQPETIVYLTARDSERGLAAVHELRSTLPSLSGDKNRLRFHQLDILSEESILRLRQHLQNNHAPAGLDVLFNNAGIYPFPRHESSRLPASYRFDAEKVEQTLKTNFFGTLEVTRQLLLVLSARGRIINISSGMGSALFACLTQQRQDEIEKCHNLQQAVDLIRRFVATNAEKYVDEKWLANPPAHELWPNFTVGDLLAYGVSKIGINMLTIQFQKQFDQNAKNQRLCFSCCPGNVMTNLNKLGTRMPDEGSDTPVYLTTSHVGVEERGKFFADRAIYDPFRYRPPW